MCVSNPQPVHIKKMIAYKVMTANRSIFGYMRVNSYITDNKYRLGKPYLAKPSRAISVEHTDCYDRGFHAYETLDDAKSSREYILRPRYYTCIVKVELLDVVIKGEETKAIPDEKSNVYVANKCTFLGIVCFS